MSFCPKCGREIFDESLGCPVCSVRDNVDYSRSGQERQEEIKAEPVTEFTVEDSNGTSQRFESRVETGSSSYRSNQQTYTEPVDDKKLHPLVKVMIIVLMLMVGGIGTIAGIIGGVVLMKNPYEDYRKFGKVMVILGSVLLVISLLCCAMGGLFNVGATYMYY